MKLYEIIVQSDELWPALNELGNHNCLHFVDCNKDKMSHKQHYAKIIKQLEEALQNLE